MNISRLTMAICILFVCLPCVADEPAVTGAPQVRMVVTRTVQPIIIDGDLSEFSSAVATPVEYFHPNHANRAAQFLYHWDDEAFYVGLRTLDENAFSPMDPLWEGDAVEWYFDTRRGDDFLNNKWGKGSLHCFWTAMKRDELNPRFCLRPGYLDAIPKTGVEVAARKTVHGLSVEFKLPWINFPNFQPQAGQIIGIDAELSFSDGTTRSDRSFVFGSPLSVLQPANLARVRLVDRFQSDDWTSSGAVMMPIRIDTPWGQTEEPQVFAKVAMPVNYADQISRIDFQLTDLSGKPLGTYTAAEEDVFQPDGGFLRRIAKWPAKSVSPGRYHVTALVYDREGRLLTRIAPRLVSVNMHQGY